MWPWDGRVDLLEQFAPRHLEAEVYLDAPDPGTVTARVLFRYGEEKREFYPEKGAETDGDRLAELRVRLVIQRYFPTYSPEEGHLILRGDDEVIYRFLTEGVEEISRVAAVYCTDRLPAAAWRRRRRYPWGCGWTAGCWSWISMWRGWTARSWPGS